MSHELDATLRRKAVFLDRDGVLNLDHGYVSRPDQFVWNEGAREAVKFLNDEGYLTFIVTNQSGIARGYYTVTEFRALHAWIDHELARVGARIDGLYFCPHLVDGAVAEYRIECQCRKPRPGMLLAAVCAHRIDTALSFMIGDKATDLEAASAAQVRGFLFRGGSLLSFVQAIVRQEPG